MRWLNYLKALYYHFIHGDSRGSGASKMTARETFGTRSKKLGFLANTKHRFDPFAKPIKTQFRERKSLDNFVREIYYSYNWRTGEIIDGFRDICW